MSVPYSEGKNFLMFDVESAQRRREVWVAMTFLPTAEITVSMPAGCEHSGRFEERWKNMK